MAPSVREDLMLPHEYVRVRVHGPILIAQPYKQKYCSGYCLLVDLLRGTIQIGEKPIDLKADYTVAHAILGVQHFRTCSAVAIVTAAQEVAVLNSHPIYKVTGTAVLTANGKPPKDKHDARLFSLLKQGVDPLSVSSGLYFSPKINITSSLQQQHTLDSSVPLWKRSTPDLWWNQHLSQPLCAIGAECDAFVMPCILGFVRQIATAPVAAGVMSDAITVTLIARRAPKRGGTRHWRRGTDPLGSVANFVETEQILETGSGEVSSMVQLRGSIPLYWSQVPNTRYKPKTAIPDAHTISATAFMNHAHAVTQQYGAVAGVNLVNQHGTEGMLSDAYSSMVQSLPPEIPFSLFTFDFHKECGASNYHNMEKLWTMIQPTVAQHGSFRTRGELGRVRSQQKGSIRTNCIDCLDRTNVVQGMIGRKALETLLRELLLLDVNDNVKTQFPQLDKAFRILWADHGDAISWQYAGTGALKSGFTRTGVRSPMGLLDDGWKSAVRYYLNNYEDGHKQDAIDLVVGSYRPRQDTPPSGPLPNGAPWVLLSLSLLFVSLSSACVAPFSKWITYLYVVLPTLGLGVGAAALVLSMGKRVTCRPVLRPDLVEPWLPENGGASTSAAASGGSTDPLPAGSQSLKKAA